MPLTAACRVSDVDVSSRQRRTHIKSRTGCARCKRMRRKCDELQPTCKRCADRGAACVYPPDVEPPAAAAADPTLAEEMAALDSKLAEHRLDPALAGTSLVAHGVAPLVEASQYQGEPTAFQLAPHGTPAVWESIDIEYMHGEAYSVAQMAHRDGHLLFSTGVQHMGIVKYCFVSEAVRHAFLAYSFQTAGHRNRDLALVRLAKSYRAKSMGLLQQDLIALNQSNAEAILAATICLMYTSPTLQEGQQLYAATERIGIEIERLTGTARFGVPRGTGFKAYGIALCSDDARDLIYFIDEQFRHYTGLVRADHFPEILPAIKNLHNFLTNLRARMYTEGAPFVPEYVDPHAFIWIMPLLPPSTVRNLGCAKPPVLIIVAFYMIMLLAERTIKEKPFVPQGSFSRNIHQANCVKRIYQRLVNEREFVWAQAMGGLYVLADMFLNHGIMRSPAIVRAPSSGPGLDPSDRSARRLNAGN